MRWFSANLADDVSCPGSGYFHSPPLTPALTDCTPALGDHPSVPTTPSDTSSCTLRVTEEKFRCFCGFPVIPEAGSGLQEPTVLPERGIQTLVHGPFSWVNT